MAMVIKSIVQADSREGALTAFWTYQEAHPGKRRASPQSFITVKQVKPIDGNRGGMWVILYTVPARVLRDIHQKGVQS